MDGWATIHDHLTATAACIVRDVLPEDGTGQRGKGGGRGGRRLEGWVTQKGPTSERPAPQGNGPSDHDMSLAAPASVNQNVKFQPREGGCCLGLVRDMCRPNKPPSHLHLHNLHPIPSHRPAAGTRARLGATRRWWLLSNFFVLNLPLWVVLL